MDQMMEQIKECPFCHSTKITKVENEKFGDLFYCSSCEHRFRYDPITNHTVKRKHSEKWDEMVEALRREGDVESPEAVATARLGEASYE